MFAIPVPFTGKRAGCLSGRNLKAKRLSGYGTRADSGDDGNEMGIRLLGSELESWRCLALLWISGGIGKGMVKGAALILIEKYYVVQAECWTIWASVVLSSCPGALDLGMPNCKTIVLPI